MPWIYICKYNIYIYIICLGVRLKGSFAIGFARQDPLSLKQYLLYQKDVFQNGSRHQSCYLKTQIKSIQQETQQYGHKLGTSQPCPSQDINACGNGLAVLFAEVPRVKLIRKE